MEQTFIFVFRVDHGIETEHRILVSGYNFEDMERACVELLTKKFGVSVYKIRLDTAIKINNLSVPTYIGSF